MKPHLRRVVCVATLLVALTGMGAGADAATLPVTAVPQPQQPTTAQHTGDQDSHSDNGLWGLLGLLGLFGLAGLMRSGPKPGAMSGYPVAGSGEPPMNTYPPAGPTRNPPGA
jgi:hypothetical protein